MFFTFLENISVMQELTFFSLYSRHDRVGNEMLVSLKIDFLQLLI